MLLLCNWVLRAEDTEMNMSSNLFDTLKARCHDDWNAYITHAFVRGLGNGSLPRECFEHYLKQDYLFLLHLEIGFWQMGLDQSQ